MQERVTSPLNAFRPPLSTTPLIPPFLACFECFSDCVRVCVYLGEWEVCSVVFCLGRMTSHSQAASRDHPDVSVGLPDLHTGHSGDLMGIVGGARKGKGGM